VKLNAGVSWLPSSALGRRVGPSAGLETIDKLSEILCIVHQDTDDVFEELLHCAGVLS